MKSIQVRAQTQPNYTTQLKSKTKKISKNQKGKNTSNIFNIK